MSDVYREGLSEDKLGIRTRRLPQEVKRRLTERGVPDDIAAIAAEKSAAFGRREGGRSGSSSPDNLTAQIMFLSPSDIEAVADAFYEVATASDMKELQKLKTDDLQRTPQLRAWRPITPDIALCGRMITSDSFRDVDAAAQVAHAISTHKMEHEFDYYTAVDDLLGSSDEDEAGAGMIGDIEFSSACYYKYFSINRESLVNNLAGVDERSDIDDAALEDAKSVAAASVVAFVKAAIFVTPSGKQNTFAAHQLPDGILVEIRPPRIPVSYANAFVKPARTHGNADLVEDSLTLLRGHATTLTNKFSLQSSKRLWFNTRELDFEGTTECETIDELFDALRQAVEKYD